MTFQPDASPLLAGAGIAHVNAIVPPELRTDTMNPPEEITSAGPVDFFIEHVWELGRDRVTVRGELLTVEQCASFQRSARLVWKSSQSVALPQLRSLEAHEVQRAFYNQTAFRTMCLIGAIVNAILFIMVIAAGFYWWVTGSSYLSGRGGVTALVLVGFIFFILFIATYLSYKSSRPDDKTLHALPAETTSMRAWTGPWLPRCILVVSHMLAFACATWAATFISRGPPFGLCPWLSVIAAVMGCGLLFHPRTTVSDPVKKIICRISVAALFVGVIMGFVASFTGVKQDECQTSEDGFLCRSHSAECTTSKTDYCESPVQALVTVQWILYIFNFFPVIFLAMMVEEISWDLDSAKAALEVAPLLVTMRGNADYGFPISVHLTEKQYHRLHAYLAATHFNARFREASLTSFGAVHTKSLAEESKFPALAS